MHLVFRSNLRPVLQVALYIWDNGNGPPLTAVPELCTEPEDSHETRHCATTLRTEPALCVSTASAPWADPLDRPLFPGDGQATELSSMKQRGRFAGRCCRLRVDVRYSATLTAANGAAPIIHHAPRPWTRLPLNTIQQII